TSLFLIVGTVLLLLIGRLGWIQFVKGDEYREEAIRNRMDDIPVPAKRGLITDRNGEELVVSISSDSVYAIPAEVRKGDPDKIARELARILDLTFEDVYKKITRKNRLVYIKTKVDPAVSREIRKLSLPGIDVVEESQRVYPKGRLASHILGIVGKDNIGLEGLEKKFDKFLAGVSGRIVTEKDATGRDIPQALHDFVPPVPGSNVVLTIDETIQYFVERELDNIMTQYAPKGATIIAMEPKTGRILAMGSRPDFDPGKYNDFPAEYRRNEAIHLNYEPGSVFKIVTSSAALEEGVVTPESRFYDPGFAAVGDRKIKCWRYPRAHGAQSFVEVVENSCNPGFVDIGLKMGKDKFYKYIRAFGFGQKTGIDLAGEATGIVINEKNVTPINIATISIGQSISVTPIQLVSAMAAVANDGVLMKPQMVQEIRDTKGKTIKPFPPETLRQVVSKSSARQLAGILEKVVSEGTGHKAYLEGYRVAGKTGTAQKAGKGGYTQGKYVASFGGFAPADDPKIAMLVVIDEPTIGSHMGGAIAAPAFQAIMRDSLRYLNVTPKLTDEEIKNKVVKEQILVPDVVNTSLEDARSILRQAGVEGRVEGEGSWVIEQQPKGGVKCPAGSSVILYLGTQGKTVPNGREVTVPDLTGLTMRETGQLLAKLGLHINPLGSGIALRQDMAPGTRVKAGTTITVTFSPRIPEASP
ncbi:MAG TPA: stage V sporulation protein D, partial [Verrucomicrobiae bacterium]|nr:stage V sporulation protein D [Verrucomicrobiae bacterium]